MNEWTDHYAVPNIGGRYNFSINMGSARIFLCVCVCVCVCVCWGGRDI
jgi:hypothetical protein